MLCTPEIADAEFRRARLWEDELWRLSAVLQGPVPGFAHLEPKRHIPFITDLDGREDVLAKGQALAGNDILHAELLRLIKAAGRQAG